MTYLRTAAFFLIGITSFACGSSDSGNDASTQPTTEAGGSAGAGGSGMSTGGAGAGGAAAGHGGTGGQTGGNGGSSGGPAGGQGGASAGGQAGSAGTSSVGGNGGGGAGTGGAGGAGVGGASAGAGGDSAGNAGSGGSGMLTCDQLGGKCVTGDGNPMEVCPGGIEVDNPSCPSNPQPGGQMACCIPSGTGGSGGASGSSGTGGSGGAGAACVAVGGKCVSAEEDPATACMGGMEVASPACDGPSGGNTVCCIPQDGTGGAGGGG